MIIFDQHTTTYIINKQKTHSRTTHTRIEQLCMAPLDAKCTGLRVGVCAFVSICVLLSEVTQPPPPQQQTTTATTRLMRFRSVRMSSESNSPHPQTHTSIYTQKHANTYTHTQQKKKKIMKQVNKKLLFATQSPLFTCLFYY